MLTKTILIQMAIQRMRRSKNELAEVFDLAVGKLSTRQREAVEHLALKSQSFAQAAMATGRSTGSLRLDWHRALKTLRAQFGGKR